jgi:hypothetical protein
MAPPPIKQTGPTGKTDTTSQTPDPTPGTGAAPEPPVPERDEPVSWVYKLHKEALVTMLSGLGLDATGTVEELRRRVVKFFRDRATDTPVPPVQTSTPSVLVPLSRPGPSIPVLTQVPTTSVPVSTPERSSRPVRVQDWRVTFNGKGDPVAFLERIEELCESDGVDADQLLPHLLRLLQGEAAAWFRNNRQRWCDWKGFVTDFRLFYFPVSCQEDLEVEISRRLQRPTEPVTTYLTELQTLLRRHGNLRPEQQLSWMYRNLLPEYRLHLRAEPAEFIPLSVPLPNQPPTPLPTALTSRYLPPWPVPSHCEVTPAVPPSPFLPGPFLPIAREPRPSRFLLFLPGPFLPIAREPRPSHFLPLFWPVPSHCEGTPAFPLSSLFRPEKEEPAASRSDRNDSKYESRSPSTPARNTPPGHGHRPRTASNPVTSLP